MKKIISLSLVSIMLVMSLVSFATNKNKETIEVTKQDDRLNNVVIENTKIKNLKTGEIVKIEDEKVDILFGDIVKTIKVKNAKDFLKGQKVKLLENQDGNQLVHFLDTSNVSFNNNGKLIEKEIIIDGETLKLDVSPKSINGNMMLPIRKPLEKLGYKVKWNNEKRQVDIIKGPHFTSIKIGENRYFKNKMAHISLSKEPIIVDSKTLLPAEFFYTILGLNLEINNGNISINKPNEDMKASSMAIKSGYIEEINFGKEGKASIVITKKLDSDKLSDKIIIHTHKDKTYFNAEIKKGKFIKVITPPIMTMSIPGQTSGVIIYSNKK
ncbi:MAG: stalk domain-containing protein [Bacillota bacterium]